MNMNIREFKNEYERRVWEKLTAGEETLWINGKKPPAQEALSRLPLGEADIPDAEARLQRFRPLISRLFPETRPAGGVIESPLTPVPEMQRRLSSQIGRPVPGRLLLKQDNALAVAGSVKARGGIYEVLKYAETLALQNGLLGSVADDYAALAGERAKAFFGQYKVQVGSTGNLGLSIGTVSAALGFQTVVHMSSDAKQWKKDLLRSRGAQVAEYDGDYGQAVKNGRTRSEADPMSYFVDDENSRDLFLGYATAALRLKKQLAEAHICVDKTHPLFVYLPCGVGSAPGGITFGLKTVFGDHAHCFFAEPTQAPCMLAGLVSGLYSGISVSDIGLSGKTAADGLAVGRSSAFVGQTVGALVSGEATVDDARLNGYIRMLWETQGIFIEPSAGVGFHALRLLFTDPAGQAYLNAACAENAAHVVWATGGGLVPQPVRDSLLKASSTNCSGVK